MSNIDLKRRTKIVATIGPATQSEEIITDLIKAGVTTFRLNFSHGDHKDHAERIKTIREVSSKLDTDIAAALMSINAVKGVNIGAGMNAAFLSGEENSDEMNKSSGKVKFKSNQAGGILGGISSGQSIVASFAVKPTSSNLTSRNTIDKKGKNTKISVKGRHDPCVGIRAVPIGEAMINCVLLDHFLMNRAQCG